jgi:hypothetical protein
MITGEDLRDVFEPGSTHEPHPSHRWQEFLYQFTECLTC